MEKKSASRKNMILGLLGFLWFLAIILSYFVNHKPIDVQIASGLGIAFWRIFLCALLFALSGGLGHFIFKRIRWQPDLHPLTLLTLSSGLGLGIIGLLIFSTGALIGLPPWYLWLAILLLPVILLRKNILLWCRHLGTLPVLWQASRPAEKMIGIILSLMMLCTLTITLAPPVYFDSLVSHLVMPQAYLYDGRISYLPWLFMSGMPQIVEVLYLPLMSLAGVPAAALLGWMSSLLTALGLLGYLQKRFSPTAAWVGIAALLCGYSFIMFNSNAYVEWFSLFFGFASLLCLDIWRRDENRSSLILCGVFIAFTVGTKYTAGAVAVALVAALAWHCWQSKRKLIPNILALSLPALALFSPWLIKNLFSTGNPIYPLLFPSGAMTSLRLEAYQNIPVWGNWQDTIFLPFRATYMGFDKASGYGMSIGPLLLALGALAWIGAKNRSKGQRIALQNAAATAVAGIVIWVLVSQMSSPLLQTRYYFALFPAFTVLAAVGYDSLASIKLPSIRLERLMLALVLLVLLLSLLHVSTDTLKSGAPQTVLGLQSEDAYLTQVLGWYHPVMEHIRQMPAGNHVLLVFEPRSFYCGERCAPDEIMDRWKRDWTTYHDNEAIKAAWKAEGFSHFLLYQSGVNFMRETRAVQYSVEEWQALDNFLASFENPLNFDDVYLLYELE
jgi:Dolichyl-phosphate-mannose-protein mannosyltransferase